MMVKNDDFLNSLDNYIKTNQIDIITLTSYKRNIFSFIQSRIARKMIFILIRRGYLWTALIYLTLIVLTE